MFQLNKWYRFKSEKDKQNFIEDNPVNKAMCDKIDLDGFKVLEFDGSNVRKVLLRNGEQYSGISGCDFLFGRDIKYFESYVCYPETDDSLDKDKNLAELARFMCTDLKPDQYANFVELMKKFL